MDSADLVACIIRCLPGFELRRAAAVARMWRTIVETERAFRLKLPRTRWALFGGCDPKLDAFNRNDSPMCRLVDVVGAACPCCGRCKSILPFLPYSVHNVSAAVMADGTIYVAGCRPHDLDENLHDILKFCPRKWQWSEVVSLPPDRARSHLTIASPDGVKLLVFGGMENRNESFYIDDRLDEFVPETNSWIARENLCEPMEFPVVLPAPDATLAYWRKEGEDGDDIAYDRTVPLFPDGDSCVLPLPKPAEGHYGQAPVTVQRMQSDLILAAVVDDVRVVVYGCKPRQPWVLLGSIGVEAPDGVSLPAESEERCTIASCRLPSPRFWNEELVVVGHSFYESSRHSRNSSVGWWGARLDVLRRIVCDGESLEVEWRDVRTVVKTSVREGAACVRLPEY